MNKYDLTVKIEKFAPLETQEKWDCSGWIIESKKQNINKVLFALTITDDIVQQAIDNNCDMIISHHPMFFVPLKYSNIDIYCAHTNLDKAEGGTTDTLIKELGFTKTRSFDFVRIVDLNSPITVFELKEKLLKISPKLRYINNNGKQAVSSIGFCAGSGSEFLSVVNTDCFITGDVKFHTAIEAKQVVFDIGHFESEVHIKNVLKEITGLEENGVIANEKSPFI